MVALASLALGIGANTAILSVLDSVTRDRLPFPRDDRVVVLRTYPLDDPSQETHARIADYFAWRDANRSFDLMGAMGHNADFGADEGGPAERIGGQSISAESFAALGAQPLLGRLFTEDDELSENVPARVIVLSHRLWQRRFFGRPDVIGQQVRLERANWTVVGVMPETFRYPNEQTSYWIPLRMDRSQLRNPQRFFVVTARLKDGVTVEQVQSDLDALSARLARANPELHEGWGVRVKPVRDAMFGWSRGRLYTLEAAIILVLLVACANVACLLLALSRDLGFDTAGLLTFEVRFPPGDFLQRRGTIAGLPYFEINPPPSIAFERMYRGLKAIPGAGPVAGVSTQLLNSLVVPSATISLDGRGAHGSKQNGGPASFAIGVGANASHLDERRTPIAAYFLVTPDFFTAIRSAKLRGRDFNEHDTAGGEWVAIINESAARRFWPESDPLGQTFTILNSPEERPRRVIGIVRDIPLTREGEYRPAVYTSYLQQPTMYPAPGANVVGQMVFMMRSAGDPMSLLPAARRVVSEVDPDRPLASVATMEQRLRFVLPQRGFVVFVITAFALTAMLLAAIGIYGVIAYWVTQRTREIGIRIAFGASRREIVALVSRRAFVFVSTGLALGLAAALAVTRLLESQLWDVSPTDPTTLGGAIVMLVLVAAAACFVPTRRAVTLNPTTALRE